MALRGRLIGQCVMLAGAAVPEGDRVILPTEAASVIMDGRLLEREPDQPVAFLPAEALDRAGERAVHVKRAFAGCRMGAHHWMLLKWKAFPPVLLGNVQILRETAAVMDSRKRADPFFHRGRETFVGRN